MMGACFEAVEHPAAKMPRAPTGSMTIDYHARAQMATADSLAVEEGHFLSWPCFRPKSWDAI